ncbi:MAG: 50S ribosomal protein L10 [Proteobacteria bacterium]|nr:50S ribosomal protein L10 [Pseudomonadota bacterium]NBX86120.1 50S ribosomal protein L10 [Pseudomonadota bacterium]
MDRNQKQAFISQLNADLAQANALVVAHYRGTTVKEITALRRSMRAAGGKVQVAKNRLAKIAFKGTPFEATVSSLMVGPTVLAYSADAVAAAKITQKFADGNDKFTILGGALGEKALDAAGIKALSSLPSLNELRGKLVGLLQAPATKLAGITQAPAGQIARVVGAYATKAA